MDQHNTQKIKHSVKGTRLTVITAIILAALILLNVGVSLIPREWSNFVADSGDAFTISATSKSFFKKLDRDVTIYYVADPDMTYDYQVAAKFRVMLDRYARLSDHVEVLYVDVGDTEFLSKYTADVQQISGSCLIVEGEERFDVILYDQLFKYYFPKNDKLLSCDDYQAIASAWISMVQSYGQSYGQDAAITYADSAVAQYYGITDFYAAISEFSSGNNLYWNADAMITATVDYVTTDNIPTTYILAGHGEAELPESFVSTYLGGLNIRHFMLDLSSRTDIPENAATLVLNDPKTDITAQEKALLEGFIAAGGSLVLTTSPEAAGLPNLMALVNGYGLDMQNAVVHDTSLSYNNTLKDDENSKTYPDEYLYFIPDNKHTLNSTASAIIHKLDCYEQYTKYMSMYQSTGVQAYLTLAQEAYDKMSQTTDYHLLVAGAHPITYRETAGVTVKELTATSDKGYLSTDDTPAKHVVGITATVTTDHAAGALIWLGYADSFAESVTGELYPYNQGFLLAALDYAGSTAEYQSGYLDIPAVSLNSALDMSIGWAIALAAAGMVILPLGALITGIVVCVKRKRK